LFDLLVLQSNIFTAIKPHIYFNMKMSSVYHPFFYRWRPSQSNCLYWSYVYYFFEFFKERIVFQLLYKRSNYNLWLLHKNLIKLLKQIHALYNITVKVYRVFPSNHKKPVSSRVFQFRKNDCRDSQRVVRPFTCTTGLICQVIVLH